MTTAEQMRELSFEDFVAEMASRQADVARFYDTPPTECEELDLVLASALLDAKFENLPGIVAVDADNFIALMLGALQVGYVLAVRQANGTLSASDVVLGEEAEADDEATGQGEASE